MSEMKIKSAPGHTIRNDISLASLIRKTSLKNKIMPETLKVNFDIFTARLFGTYIIVNEISKIHSNWVSNVLKYSIHAKIISYFIVENKDFKADD
ncbi:hypothetical protein CWI38_0457p0010 [Hamiltosporidium tvaerminnensis]|uniref:Uncharacterized protein n=1 Tax=Hamiltosporidium tvaerminnensis TaxID=1176355 RepID=A0A4Q9LZX2_9MICR|nr:hypothetical protein CWI38_0457p0010 [Hamiltosporidium tvaerminnensis]